MSQKDNEQNQLQAAQAIKLTKLSQEDNRVMMRDSHDMRAITIITLSFLPATFVATFFSTSFFDFSPAEGKMASGWLWIYWVVTVGLTMSILGGWLWISRKMEKDVMGRKNLVGKEKKENRRKHVRDSYA